MGEIEIDSMDGWPEYSQEFIFVVKIKVVDGMTEEDIGNAVKNISLIPNSKVLMLNPTTQDYLIARELFDE